MDFQYNAYFGTLILTALIAATVAFEAWQRRSASPASKPFVGVMMAIAGYATAAALEAAAVTLPDKILWSKLEYVGSGSVIALFVTFALHFTHHQRWLTPRNSLRLWFVPIFNAVLVATNDWHKLVWPGFTTSPDGSQVIYQHGVGFFWVFAWSALYVLAGMMLFARTALHASILHRQQSRMILAGAAIPLIGTSLYTFSLVPPGLNITPMSFMLTGVIHFVSLFQFRMFDLIPVARDILLESLSDGVLVLDTRNRIIDINSAAQQLIGINGSCIGQFAQNVLPQWQDIVRFWHDDDRSKTGLLTDSNVPRYVELRIMPLQDHRKQLTGRLLILRDVTQQHQAEVKLREANKDLQQQLVRIETLQAQLQEQAIRDSLTGLFNRRYLEETLPRELIRAAREGYPVSLILMDIDFFKAVNDTFGHQGGDRVLQIFGTLLQTHSRSSDIACRYGGEEFLLALPGMSLESAYQRAEQIRRSVQAAQIPFGDQVISTTISGGLGVFPNHGETSDDLLQNIDQALYAAKADGRNRLKFASML